MKKLLILAAGLFAGYAVAQTCIVQAPNTPPTPTRIIILLPADGGPIGCTAIVQIDSGGQAKTYALDKTRCAPMLAFAKQASSIDNGWADGGQP